MRSSVACVASTARWPARAWSEWPWVMRARSTGRVGSIWKAPSLQHTPAGVGSRMSWGRMGVRYDLNNPMTGGPLFVSSGDLIADRRYKWALDQAARGDLAGAADILAQTVELVPGFATAWFALGAIRDNLGDRAGAIAAWEKARDADPEDYHGARLQLARIGAGERTPAMTATYIRRLFDQHAASFDESLLERLDYRAPAVLLAAVRGVTGGSVRIGSMLDLGCGTGLGGAAFRPQVDWLVGVDVSPGMVAKARAKGLYDRLSVLELQQF